MAGTPSEKKVRVALAQIQVELGNRKKNQSTIRKWMEKYYTPSKLPTAVVLPELWDVGYALDSVPELSDPNGEQALAFLGELAKEYGTWFVGGSVMVRDKESFYNRSQAINPSGELISEYNKAHLVPFITKEDDIFTPGNSANIFDFSGVKSGSIICYDMRFPEWVRTYALDGAEILFVSGQWTPERMHLWKTMLCAHAIENLMYVVATNNCGPSGDLNFGGGSLVCSPAGEVLLEAGTSANGMFVDLDLSSVQSDRTYLKVFEKRRPELYRRLVE